MSAVTNSWTKKARQVMIVAALRGKHDLDAGEVVKHFTRRSKLISIAPTNGPAQYLMRGLDFEKLEMFSAGGGGHALHLLANVYPH